MQVWHHLIKKPDQTRDDKHFFGNTGFKGPKWDSKLKSDNIGRETLTNWVVYYMIGNILDGLRKLCVSLQNSESSIEIPLHILKFWAENITVSDLEALFKLQVDKSNNMGQKMWQH